MNDFELRAQLRALRVDQEPVRDLWAGIEVRLAPRRRRLPAWPVALAASLVLLFAAQRLLRPEPPAPPATGVDTIAEAATTPRRQSEGIELSYRAALAELSTRPLPGALRPAAREIDASLREIELALAQSPDSPPLLAQLRRTYEARIRLEQRALALGSA